MANITSIDSICVDVRQYGRRKTPVLMALIFLICLWEKRWKNKNFSAAGIIPWNATPGKACGNTLSDICSTSEVGAHPSPYATLIRVGTLDGMSVFNPNACCSTFQFYLSYHLYIVACAGAGATVIALVSFPPLCPSSAFSLCRVCADGPRVSCSSLHPHMEKEHYWLLLSSIRCPICIAAHGRFNVSGASLLLCTIFFQKQTIKRHVVTVKTHR